MNPLNQLIIEGNAVRQAELSEPSAGFKVCNFSVAVNRRVKNRNGEDLDEVSYFDVETYGKMADFCEKQITKGRGVRIVGRLKQNKWKDSDGKTHTKVYIVAEHVEYKPIFNDKSATNSETVTEQVADKSFEKLEETEVF